MTMPVTTYIPRNLPKEEAEALQKQLIEMPRPAPIDPAKSGDEIRFEAEFLEYTQKRDQLLVEKKLCDELARTVDMAIPSKRREFLKRHFKMMENTKEGRAFIQKFGKPKVIAPKK